ncbi:MAG: class I SAM-dependent methyltransferase [Candidatus Dormibacteraceae bacterium]
MPEGDFERLYAGARGNLRAVPWALLEPHPSFVEWLNRRPAPHRDAALVVGCGLGDDAEEAARRGYAVVAFDLSPSAIRLARKRFPTSAVDYQVADLRDLPGRWAGAFDLVVEIRTLQSLPRGARGPAIAAVAGCTAPGGVVFVRGMLEADGGRRGGRPWPLRRSELAAFGEAGLTELEFAPKPSEGGFVAVYQRPPR